MKNCTVLLALLAAFVLAFGTSTRAGTIHDDLIVLYEFENNANLGENNSTVASGNSGTVNGTVTQDSGGLIDNAAQFTLDGLVNNIDAAIADVTAMSATVDEGFSVSLWMKHGGIPDGDGIDSRRNFWFAGAIDTPDNINFNYQGSTDFYWSNGPLGQVSDGTLDPVLDDNTWHQLGFTMSAVSAGNRTAKLFLDGSKIDELTAADGALTTTSFTVARGASDKGYDGLMDDFAVWGREVSESEMGTIHSQGLLGVGVIPEPGTFALSALGLLSLAFVAWRKRRSR